MNVAVRAARLFRNPLKDRATRVDLDQRGVRSRAGQPPQAGPLSPVFRGCTRGGGATPAATDFRLCSTLLTWLTPNCKLGFTQVKTRSAQRLPRWPPWAPPTPRHQGYAGGPRGLTGMRYTNIVNSYVRPRAPGRHRSEQRSSPPRAGQRGPSCTPLLRHHVQQCPG